MSKAILTDAVLATIPPETSEARSERYALMALEQKLAERAAFEAQQQLRLQEIEKGNRILAASTARQASKRAKRLAIRKRSEP